MWSNRGENLSNCWSNGEKITTCMTGDIKGSDHCFIGKIPGWSKAHLRTTVPLVSYIWNSLRFWYYASLSNCCQNHEKKLGSPGKFWEKAGVKLLRDLTEKSVNFSTLATSNIRFLLVFGEEDQ